MSAIVDFSTTGRIAYNPDGTYTAFIGDTPIATNWRRSEVEAALEQARNAERLLDVAQQIDAVLALPPVTVEHELVPDTPGGFDRPLHITTWRCGNTTLSIEAQEAEVALIYGGTELDGPPQMLVELRALLNSPLVAQFVLASAEHKEVM